MGLIKFFFVVFDFASYLYLYIDYIPFNSFAFVYVVCGKGGKMVIIFNSLQKIVRYYCGTALSFFPLFFGHIIRFRLGGTLIL